MGGGRSRDDPWGSESSTVTEPRDARMGGCYLAPVSMSTLHIVLLIAAGVGLAFANTLASAGSAVSLPVLLSLGLGAEVANGTNRVAVVVGGIAAVVTFARHGQVDWRNVAPFATVMVAGGIVGVFLSEMIAPQRLHVIVVGALFVAVAILFLNPRRWLTAEVIERPRRGPLPLALLFVVGFWLGFIVLDGATYLLFVLVIAVGYDVLRANAMKSVLLVITTGASLVVLAARGSIDWGPAGLLSLGAIGGGLLAARLAMRPGSAVWVYRLLVVVIVGEVINLGLQAAKI